MTTPATASLGEAAWRAAVTKVLKGGDPDGLVRRTDDGIAVAPLYPPAEVPATMPFRRPLAIYARLDAPEIPARDELEGGADGLVLAMAAGPSARGFGIDPGELAAVLAEVPIERVPLRFDPGPFAGLDALHALLGIAEERRIDPQALALDVGIDPLGSLARGGEPPFPWDRLAAYLAEGVAAIRSRGVTGAILRASGRPYHEAGATEAQELAAVVATGLAYLRVVQAAGFDLDSARASLSFLLAADVDQLLTLAKCRALRQVWARLEEAAGLEPVPLRLHAETSWRMLTRRDPQTNILRGTIACAAAILGGADGVTVLPYNLALGLPDANARRLARNTALILRDEAGLDRVADPAAGAGAAEALTEALAAETWSQVQEIEREGGLAAALASGALQGRIGAARARRARALADGQRVLVGTTVHPLETEPPAAVLRPAPAPQSPSTATALPSLRDDDLVGGPP